jgi:hypothetical protein
MAAESRGMGDYYALLDLSPDASPREVRAAWRRAALLCHPDRNPGLEAASHERFIAVSEAYSVLRDRHARAAYDRRVGIVREAAASRDPVQRRQPAPRAAPTLREHRRRVRKLAEDLAAADSSGRLLGWTLLVLSTASVLALIATIPGARDDIPWFPPGTPVLAGLAALVLATWRRAVRGRLVERYEPVAEEVLRRTKKAWRRAVLPDDQS